MASTWASDELFAFFDDLVRCETRLYNAIGEPLRSEHGLTTSQFELLRFLRHHPGSRVAEVATNFAAGVGAISKSVDRLESSGWVIRVPNPDDGRSSLISLTSAGAAKVAAGEEPVHDQLQQLLATVIDTDGLRIVAETVSMLRDALEQGRVGTPTG